MLRATTACTFSTSQLPKVVRSWCVLYILTSKSASRHNGVQFFITHLASWLRTRHFSEPTFRPSGATNHWKNTMFRDFPPLPFAHLRLLSSYSFSSTLLSFNLPLLSASSLLCFSAVHIVGSLTSKLPSTILTYIIGFFEWLKCTATFLWPDWSCRLPGTSRACKASKVEREVAEEPTPKHILTKVRASLDFRWILD